MRKIDNQSAAEYGMAKIEEAGRFSPQKLARRAGAPTYRLSRTEAF
jgi:hypothetical protein